MSNILVASLGESPIVVTAMYQHLREKIQIDTVMVLRPEGEYVRLGYDMIKEALQGKYQLEYLPLPFEDANGESESYRFLQLLAGQLQAYQQIGDSVYLSLAGGRKNMSALIALVVPFFSCVKSLYQVLDVDEVHSGNAGHQFKSVTQLFDLSDTKRAEAFSPPLDKILLVKIPYEEQRVSEQLLTQMYTLDDVQLKKLWEENPAQAEATEFGRLLTRPDVTGRILDVLVTEHVRDEYAVMCKQDVFHAKRFATCFEQMRYADKLADPLSQHGYIKHNSRLFHYYKRPHTAERPFYHTEPEGIHRYPHADVRRVVISGLAIEREGEYEPNEKTLLKLPLEPVYPLQLFSTAETVLIVPLGTAPMVATQLYALLKNEGRTIREVAIIYPTAQKVLNSAELLKDAFAFEYPALSIQDVPVAGMKDIVSEEDCKQYQQVLEETIDTLRERHPNCEIVLALSGGRKSMAALAMFAAQRKGIRYVYHTLIKDPTFSEDIEEETSVRALRSPKISKQECNDRLFLRAYQDKLVQFVLFKVPVVPHRIVVTR